MKLKTLIVDDEAPARSELRYMLERVPNVQVVGEATNATEALELIKALNYDLVFIDVQMPGLSGLDVVAATKELERAPAIIFVTAYSEYALKAFELDAVDYLLKPIDEDRLNQAVAKVDKRKDPQPRASKTEPLIEIERIPVESRGKTLLLPMQDVVYISSRNDIVFVHTAENTYITRFTLKALEERLRNKSFLRVHRGYIVNLSHVTEIVPMYGRSYILKVRCNQKNEIPVSRRRGQKLKAMLGM
ncbi:MAG TPA: response regulator [Anaerolineae bacterium]|jgi:DNA-binding LytR/AlgR family response regulator|nr:response regulator [Anaerolineae bacterium]